MNGNLPFVVCRKRHAKSLYYVLSSVTKHGKDGNGLKLEKIDRFLMPKSVMVSCPC